MEVGFYKDVYHEYMVVDRADGEADDSFEEQLLHNKEIQGLLRMKMEYMGEACKYYYDIGRMESLESIKTDKKLDYKMLSTLFEAVQKLLAVLDNYLLTPESLWLEPEGIYKKRGENTFRFAYVPGYVRDFKEQLKELLSWLMKNIDHGQKDTVMFVYGFYNMLSEEDSAAFALENLENAKCQLENTRTSTMSKLPTMSQKLPMSEISQQQPLPEISHVVRKQSVSKSDSLAEGDKKRPMTFVSADINEEKTAEEAVQIKAFILYFTAAAAALLVGFILKNTLVRLFYLMFGVYISSWAVLLVFIIAAAGLAAFGVRDFVNGRCKKPKEDSNRDFWQESQRPDYSTLTMGETVILSQEMLSDILVLKRMEGDAFERDTIYITSTPFVIGKQYESVDYHLGDNGVSRRHLEIRKEGRRYEAVDLSSTNGTWINGSKVESGTAYEIKHGDVLKIANIPFSVLLKERQ